MKKVTTNIVWNMVGYSIPIILTIIIMPFTIKELGNNNFGKLSFIWMLVGYSSFLDMGIGRALTHFISNKIHTLERSLIKDVVIKVMLILLLFIVIVFILSQAILSFLTYKHFYINDSNYLLFSVSIITALLVILSSASRGVLEGFQAFKYINIIKVISGGMIALSPYFIYKYAGTIEAVILVFAIIRCIEFLLYSMLSFFEVKTIGLNEQVSWSDIKNILKYGLWSNLTNLAGSPMAAGYLDKAYIVFILGAASLTYYTVPFDIISRFLILPAMITSALFPALIQEKNDSKANEIISNTIQLICFLILPCYLFAIIQAKNILGIWLGTISEHMYLIFQILAIGKFAESLNFVYLMKIQANGRPDLTAKRHFYELPFYIVIQFFLIYQFGLIGAAIGWCLWAIFDFIYLYTIACKLSDNNPKLKVQANIMFIVFSVVLSLVFSVFFESSIISINISISFFISVIYVFFFMFCFYHYFLSAENKNKIYFIRLKLLGKL